jgi:hypothetical protein
MKKIDIFQIETVFGTGHISAASRLVRSLMGVEWGDLNSTATELIVTYDDRWITRPGIASALNSMGVTCKYFPVSEKSSSIAVRPESRAAQKIRLRKQEYRCNCLRSPKPVCGCC